VTRRPPLPPDLTRLDSRVEGDEWILSWQEPDTPGETVEKRLQLPPRAPNLSPARRRARMHLVPKPPSE
jgi:hypothetical protein